MNLNDYQQHALSTANPKDANNEFYHLVLGLVGEAGEIAEKVKKNIRNDNSDMAKLDAEDIKLELGDVLWHIAVLADYFDIPMEDVATANVAKLADRKKRGVIKSTGDYR